MLPIGIHYMKKNLHKAESGGIPPYTRYGVRVIPPCTRYGVRGYPSIHPILLFSGTVILH
jgi:hypothetical protein